MSRKDAAEVLRLGRIRALYAQAAVDPGLSARQQLRALKALNAIDRVRARKVAGLYRRSGFTTHL